MKQLLIAFVMFLAVLSDSRATTIIRIRVDHTNGSDRIRINDRDTDDAELSLALTKLAAIDPRLFTLLQVDPQSSASTTLNVLRIVRDAGLKGITIAPWRASYDLCMTFSSVTNTQLQSRLRELEDEADKEHGRLEDGVVITCVQGGPPLPAAVPVTNVVAEVRGERFAPLRKSVEIALAPLGKDRTWWDVGPDSSFMSAQICIGTNRYTLNSWFPLERANPRIAVSETRGLVSVSDAAEKARIESGNSAKYKALMAIFEMGMASNTNLPAGKR